MTTGVTPPERLGSTRLSNGRRLGWAEWGPESGTPILMCSGSATSRWLGLPVDTIRRLGIRLIAVDRPGLGMSSAAADWTLGDWTRDISEFAEARELLEMAAIGYSIGAPFALACAEVPAVTGVSLVSGTDELAHPALAPALEPEVALLVKRVAASASDTERLIATSADADVLWDVVVGTSHGADQRVYADPAFNRSYRRALAEGFSQGPAGYARETVLAMSRWPFDPSTISIPVDLWYGDQDANPFHSPDLGATLARRIPAAHRFVVPNMGGAFLWTHTDRILRSLLHRIAVHR
ncbi:alpha/beta fold hydrolase [Streptomyces sp. CA-106131]|uniref:alpha/beta fold hydrolase n=1 Tax=Streptomyces sp. CA-106131 TaxID=3240045 RepID=UPI003D8F3616